jgi:adenine-specific DNA-methyltransferase
MSGTEWRVYRKDYLHDEDGVIATTLPKSLWLDGNFSNDYGRRSIKQLFGAPVMDFPKSPALLQRIVEISTRSDDLIVDFFAGSSSTAHAVLATNAADGGSRRFVMVQINEATPEQSHAAKAGFVSLSALSMERIRRAGQEAKHAPDGSSLDVGFRVLKIDSPTVADVGRLPGDTSQEQLSMLTDSVVEGRTGEDLLFHVLLDWGLELSVPIVREMVGDSELFVVDDGLLIACFVETLTREVITGIAQRQPERAVFRDSGFATDADRINAQQVFGQLSPHTELRTV